MRSDSEDPEREGEFGYPLRVESAPVCSDRGKVEEE